jgi:hypothetical protein
LLCGTLLNHIKDLKLELRLKKDKVEKAEVEKVKVELRLEEELKEAVFVKEKGTGATSNGKNDVNATSSKAKSDKLAKSAKLAKLAKSTDLWCLLPYVPLSQEAKDKAKQKQRKVCLVNLRGEVCMADNCGSKHS